jgi:hypothetical protein
MVVRDVGFRHSKPLMLDWLRERKRNRPDRERFQQAWRLSSEIYELGQPCIVRWLCDRPLYFTFIAAEEKALTSRLTFRGPRASTRVRTTGPIPVRWALVRGAGRDIRRRADR